MFSEEIKYQLDFAKESKIYHIFSNGSAEFFKSHFQDIKNFLIDTEYKKISLVSPHEAFARKEDIEKLVELIKENDDKQILISASTSTFINEYFYNPLVSLSFWKDTKMRYNISWKSKNYIKLFDERLYNQLSKSNKGILSVRKETDFRSYLFSLINANSFEGIIRYGKWPYFTEVETEADTKKSSNFPNIIQLLDEYKKSYVSFIVETQLSDFMNCMTEKTIISFLTRTMPIVLGGKNYVKELKDMGFYVWNDEFGFDGDDFESLSDDKAISYNKCIENYNKMSKSDIEDMYNSNIDKIENNYKIIRELLFDSKTIL